MSNNIFYERKVRPLLTSKQKYTLLGLCFILLWFFYIARLLTHIEPDPKANHNGEHWKQQYESLRQQMRERREQITLLQPPLLSIIVDASDSEESAQGLINTLLLQPKDVLPLSEGVEILIVSQTHSVTNASQYHELAPNLNLKIIGFPVSKESTILNRAARSAAGGYLYFVPSTSCLTDILNMSSPSSAGPKYISSRKSIPSFISSRVWDIMATAQKLKSSGISATGSLLVSASPNDTLIGSGIGGNCEQGFHLKKRGYHPLVYISSSITERGHVVRHGLMIDKKKFESVGGFDPLFDGLPYLQDIDFDLRYEQAQGQFIASQLSLRLDDKLVDRLYPARKREYNAYGPMEDGTTTAKSFTKDKQVLPQPPSESTSLMWDGYCGCTGLNIETIGLLAPLEGQVRVSTVSGPECFCPGFPQSVKETMDRISSKKITSPSFFVSHKPPTNYPKWPYRGNIVIENRPKYVIGRSMTESDPMPDKWLERIESVDEVWVPSTFHFEQFVRAGVPKDKVIVMPEAVDVDLWNPHVTRPLKIEGMDHSKFLFFSVFKWEDRKGWDVLLEAFMKEFKPTENVELWLQTYLYGVSDYLARDVQQVMAVINDFAKSKGLDPRNIHVTTQSLPETDMPSLYKNFDAFVLPTRGEGWGLPIIEAMSMELPVIATNWSGQTEFMREDNSYLIPIDGIEESDVEGQRWAKPSLPHLMQLMRRVSREEKEAKERGKLARQHVVEHFSMQKFISVLGLYRSLRHPDRTVGYKEERCWSRTPHLRVCFWQGNPAGTSGKLKEISETCVLCEAEEPNQKEQKSLTEAHNSTLHWFNAMDSISIPDYLSQLFSFNETPDVPQQIKRKSSNDFGDSQGEEIYDSGNEEPSVKRLKVSNDPILVAPFCMEENILEDFNNPSFPSHEPDYDFLSSIQDLDWDAALATAIAQTSSSSDWMKRYDSLRKAVNAGENPSSEDIKWFETQMQELQNNSLTPERSELLRQAIDMMTFASFERSIREEPSTETTNTTPAFLPIVAPLQEPVTDVKPIINAIQATLPPQTFIQNTSPTILKSAKIATGKMTMKRNQLASWMCTQRQDRKSGELPSYRIQLLDLIDFAWTKHHKKRQANRDQLQDNTDEQIASAEVEILNAANVVTFTGRQKKNHELWILRFHELWAFKKANGHLKVPTHIPDVPG
ncbi:glycosyltransferase, CAZy family GT4 [Planoprotostelium fungivorum]|uniref:Glycosyltransferase, CAZy family GT4 n=1 Tax=Planoprotostelium fungivorum TaxID=1890364 RepID=A0A2P6N815_9EUKA|nr:glycosyltransferase, CAZy family GT4 [Planoprotostelium fungivorum]